MTISPGRVSRASSVAAFSAAIFLAGLSLAATAASTLITFDDQPAGTPINSQYHNPGVDFDGAGAPVSGQLPVVAAHPENRSPPNVLDISGGYPLHWSSECCCDWPQGAWTTISPTTAVGHASGTRFDGCYAAPVPTFEGQQRVG